MEDGTYSKEYVLNNACLCSSHFEDSAFTSSLKIRLSVSALPKSSVVNNITTRDEGSASVTSGSECFDSNLKTAQSSDCIDKELMPKIPICDSTPKSTSKYRSRVVRTPKTKKILQLKAKNRALQRKIKLFSNRNSGLEELKNILSMRQYEFVLSQLKIAKLKDKRGSRWSSKDKAMALNIYFHSPAAYRILRKYFAFPSKSTLQRSTGQIAKSDGFCPKVRAVLTEKAKKMAPNERLCTLVFDEMAIKTYLSYNATLDVVDGFESCKREDGSLPQLATQALVFMIRGLSQNWKQVIAYYFRSNTLPETWFKDTCLDIIQKVNDCGFQIVATVCDQGPFNQSLYKSLGVTHEQPFFTFNGSLIFALFDMPHLLKSVRNNLKKYDITFLEMKDTSDVSKSMRASWQDIEAFYDKDSKQRFRVAPKLSYKHVFARGLATMKVKLAAQIFSHSVAAGLCVYANTGQLISRALHTAEFVGTMNDLFDSMNSKKRFSKGYTSAVSDGSEHVEFWKKSLKWVESWKFVAPSGKVMKPACQKGLQMTLSGTIGIWERVNKDISFLLTNRLNQDCIENTFSSIRRKGGFRDNPSSFEFRSSIRSVIVYSFVKKANSNCEEDNDINLFEINKPVDQSILATLYDASNDCNFNDDSIEDEMLPLIIDDFPIPTTNVIENNVIAYIAGFLSKKYLKTKLCEECENLLVGPKDLDTHTLLLYFKEYNDTEFGLKWPTNEFYESMVDMSEIFFMHIDNYFNKPNIRKNLIALMRSVNFEFFKDHAHKDEAKKFFIFSFVTMMIKHRIRTTNGEIYIQQVENKKLKKVKHI